MQQHFASLYEFSLENGKLCTWIYVILFLSNNKKAYVPLSFMLIISKLLYLICDISLFQLILLDPCALVDFIPLLFCIILFSSLI